MKRKIVNSFFLFQFAVAASGSIWSLVDRFELFDSSVFYPLLVFDFIALALLFPFVLIVFGTPKIPLRHYLPILVAGLIPWFAFDADLLLVGWTPLVASIYCFVERRKFTGSKWAFYPSEIFASKGSAFSRTIALSTAFFILFAASIGGSLFNTFQKGIEQISDGHLRLKFDGIYSETKIFKKDGKKVCLIGMMHIGDEEFYKKVLSEIPSEESLVMLEGFRDKNGVLKGESKFEARADALGKVEQTVFNDEVSKTREFRNVDIDFSQLSPEAQEYARISDAKESTFTALLLAKDATDEEKAAQAKFMEERNVRAMQYFDLYVKRYNHLIMPWGAAHVSYFSKALEERGYELIDSREKKALSFF